MLLKEITINFISDVAISNSALQDFFFLVYATMTKLMDAILQNLQVWRANRKKQYSMNMKIITLEK